MRKGKKKEEKGVLELVGEKEKRQVEVEEKGLEKGIAAPPLL